MNHIAQRGADVIYEGIKHVHVSGHGSEEELKLMHVAGAAEVLRPDAWRVSPADAPRPRRRARHDGATEVIVIENGDVLRFDGQGADDRRARADVGRVFIDGTRTGEIADEVLRDRKHLAADGLVVPMLAINSRPASVAGTPDVITRGFVRRRGADARGAAMISRSSPAPRSRSGPTWA